MTASLASRRRFLQSSVAALAGAWAAPRIVPSSALGLAPGTVAPSQRITVGLIGCGNHGISWNMKQVFRCPDVQIVGVCDVDKNHLAEGQKTVDKNYGPIFGDAYKPCPGYGDFRKLVNRKDIDAISNHTPDHWHVIPAIMAARAGKDVISEKPLSLTVAEGRILANTMKETGRIFQTASENRSLDVYIRLTELVRGGVIGKLKHIEVSLPLGNTEMRLGPMDKGNFQRRAVEPVPPELDYEMWLGQAPKMPYIPARLHGSFRWNLAFSGGVLTDWGAHLIDLAQWGHDTEHTGPVEVEGKGDFPPRDAVFNTAATFMLHYKYGDGVTMNVSTSEPSIRFEGTDGWIECRKWRGTLQASRRDMLDVVIDHEKVPIYRPSEIIPRTEAKGGEHRNFYDCVKSRQPTYAPAETGHRTITIAHIGNIAMQLGRKLRWDPEAEKFTGDDEANSMLSRRQREPWAIENIGSWVEKNA